MARNGIIISVCIISAFVALIFSSQGLWGWHYYHIAMMPKDLFAPILTDDFEFHTKGFSKEYALNPNYRDIYEVSIAAPSNTVPSGWGKHQLDKAELKGKIKIELFANNTKLLEKTVTNWRRATYQAGNMNFFKSFSIYDFPIPINNLQIEQSKISITVIEPYIFLQKYNNNIKLEIKVAATE